MLPQGVEDAALYKQIEYILCKKGGTTYRCLPLLFGLIESTFAYFSFKKSREN